MRRQILVVAALCGLVGCGDGDDQIDREQLVPQGMRRTVVTAGDAPTTPTPAAAPAARPVAHAPADSTDQLVTHAPADSSLPGDMSLVDEEVLADDAAPPAAAPAVAAQSPAGRFVVQAGAYRQLATAEGVAGKVQALGVTTRLETVETGSGTLHRVLVPGMADRAAADTLVVRLKQELGIDAAVRKP